MKTATLPIEIKGTRKTTPRHEIIQFYEEATEDYSFWSKDLNMHFGYCSFGRTNPFRRDTMLNEMNRQIYNRIELKKGSNLVADLGCGMGGTMRNFLKRDKDLSMWGVTLSPFQVCEGNKLLKDTKGVIFEENYCETSIPESSMDGVVAVESLCHSGHSKESLQEAYRIVKPNARLVIVDAFLKKQPLSLCRVSGYIYAQLCEGWSLDGLGVIKEVEKNLKEIGFKNIKIEDTSYRTAISVFHVPFAICGFLLKNMWQGKSIKPESWNNLKASFFALLSGLHMKDFGYFIITAEK